MLKSLLEIIRQLLGYANDTQKNTADIKTLQTNFDEMSDTVRQIIFEIDRDRQIGARDRENLLLRLENALLKNEQRALPPGSPIQNPTELEARVVVLERETDALKMRVLKLETPQ